LTSAKKNATASPSSINATNNFSTAKFNASSATSTKPRGIAKWKQDFILHRQYYLKLFATIAAKFSNTLKAIFLGQNSVGFTTVKNATNHTGLTIVIH
jgi:hypothetical protein